MFTFQVGRNIMQKYATLNIRVRAVLLQLGATNVRVFIHVSRRNVVIIHHSKNNAQSLINLVQLFCPIRCGRQQHFLYWARKKNIYFFNITMTRISVYIYIFDFYVGSRIVCYALTRI